jgi:hypothetical protein
MEEEYATLMSNDTWDLIPHPHNTNVVTNKWIFKHKFKADGTLEGYKTRWVLRGFMQRPEVDYDETFSTVVKPAMVWTVLSLALSQDWPIHKLNIRNAFLHGVRMIPLVLYYRYLGSGTTSCMRLGPTH